MPVFLLSDSLEFPPPELATKEGLLAVGGDLVPQRLELAYRHGIFPWYSKGDPILWWSPDPRLVIYPNEFKPPRRLQRQIRQGRFQVTADKAFDRVIGACARSRVENGEGTWIVEEMIRAYSRLHRLGLVHSVEAWQDGHLAGGLYGMSLGRAFFGESMFTQVSNASKAALARLVAFLQIKGFHFLDCQVTTDHLVRFGAREIPRRRFLVELRKALATPTIKGPWTEAFHELTEAPVS